MELWYGCRALEVAGMHVEPRMLAVSCIDSAVANRICMVRHPQSPQRRGRSRGMWPGLLSPPYSDPLPNAPLH